MKGLKGKLALVTGAGAGIGKGIVTRLAEEGVDLVVTDVNPDTAKATAEELRTNFGTKAFSMKLDVTSSGDVESAVESVWKEHGPLNILVNNAGVSSLPRGTWASMSTLTCSGVIPLSFDSHTSSLSCMLVCT